MIKLKNFGKSYNKNIIFNNVEIEFPSKKITFIMGPNGAGKTTLIKSIFKLEEYDGEIRFNENLNIDDIRKSCLVIWDDCPFYTNLSGIKNLLIYAEKHVSKQYIKNIALKYLDTDLLKRKIKSYSYGQKKKLALVLIDILNPEIIIMDEISNGLDYDTMLELKKYLVEISKDRTIILTGHQFDFYNDIIDNLVILKNHNLIQISENFKNSGEKLGDIYENELHSKWNSINVAF